MQQSGDFFFEAFPDFIFMEKWQNEDVHCDGGREEVDVVGAEVVWKVVQLSHLDVVQSVDAKQGDEKD